MGANRPEAKAWAIGLAGGQQGDGSEVTLRLSPEEVEGIRPAQGRRKSIPDRRDNPC